MENFRLPDPPRELRSRVLDAAAPMAQLAETPGPGRSPRDFLGTILISCSCLVLFAVVGVVFFVPGTPARRSSDTPGSQETRRAETENKVENRKDDPKKDAKEGRETVTFDIGKLFGGQDTIIDQKTTATTMPKAPPEALRCTLSGDKNGFIITLRLENKDHVFFEPVLAALPSKWCHVFDGINFKLVQFDFSLEKNEELDVRDVKVVEGGVLLSVRADPRADGRFDLKARGYYFAKQALVWSVKEDVVVASGEEKIFRPK